jgi:hypothetical protein
MKSRKKALDERIEADVRALRDDLRQMGADLAATLRSRRSRRRVKVPAGKGETQGVVTEVSAEAAPAGEYPQRPRRRFRALAVFFALGAVVALFLLRRRKVYVVDETPPDRRRPRLGLPWPRRVTSRRATIETEKHEPAGRKVT